MLARRPPTALAAAPPTSVVPYQGVAHSIGEMLRAVRSPRGASHPSVRLLAEDIVREIAPKDYLSEVLAIRYWVNQHVPYLRDPQSVEWMRDPAALIEEIRRTARGDGQYGIVRADCDEIAMLGAVLCMAVGCPASFATVGFVRGGPPTHVLAVVKIPKGTAPIVIDPVAGTRELKMLGQIQTLKMYPIEEP